MKTKTAAKKIPTRHAFEVAKGTDAAGLVVTVYRRGTQYGAEGDAYAAITIGTDDSRQAKAGAHRLAAELELVLDGISLAPVCMTSGRGGEPILWIEDDPEALNRNLGMCVMAARKLGFAV